MSSVLTNRLIGSAILIVAAIVFLPDVLDGQKHVHKDDFKAVPERPEFAEVTAPQTFNADQHQAAMQQAQALPVETQPALDAASTDPQPTADPSQATAAPAGSAPATTDTAAVQVGTMEKPLAVPGMTANSATTNVLSPAATASTTPATSTTEPVVSTTSVADKKAAGSTTALQDPLKQNEAELAKEANADKPLAKSGFMVKVGAFGKEANANALIAKLKAAGLTTFTRKVVNSQGVTMIAVFVGPDLKKDKLEKALPQIQQISNGQNLRVSSYQPVEN